MKRALRIALVVASIFALIPSFLVFLSAGQIKKNRAVLADMKDRVAAIHSFKNQAAKLPDQNEFSALSKGLPVRYHLYDYRIDTKPNGSGSDYPKGWPASGGWVLWFWRGEWAEYYSSWDDHYTLSRQASWIGFCGPLLLFPILAVGLFCVSRHKWLKG